MTPYTYLLVSLMMSSVMLCVIFYITWHSFGRQPHALAWSIAFAFGALQWGLNVSSPWLFDDRRVFWVIGGAIAIVVVSFALIGFRRWAAQPVRHGWLWGVGLGVWTAVTWATFVQPHVGINMALGPIYGSVICLLIASIIWRRRANSNAAEVGAAVVFVVFAVTQIIAGTAAFLQGAHSDPRLLEIYLQVNFLALPTGYIGMGLFTVFILAADLSDQMRGLARTDQLTSILNRRGFDEAAVALVDRARRYNDPLALLLCDLDRFKQINDHYGHITGDRALVTLADYFRKAVRRGDIVARVGGEEFVLALPNQNLDGALEMAERLRANLAELAVDPEHPNLRITASFGVTELLPNDQTIYDLFARADRALYRCKREGRNQVKTELTVRPIGSADRGGHIGVRDQSRGAMPVPDAGD